MHAHSLFSEDILHLHEPGYPLWMSREEYTLFGAHQLAAEGPQQLEEG